MRYCDYIFSFQESPLGQVLLGSLLDVEEATTEAEQLSPVCTAGDRGAAVPALAAGSGSRLLITSHPASQGGPLGKAVTCRLCVGACIVSAVRPRGLWPARLLCPWDSPGKNTGVGCHLLLQGIFPTQGSTPSLPGLLHWHWPADSLPLCQLGSANTSFACSKCDSCLCLEVDLASLITAI